MKRDQSPKSNSEDEAVAQRPSRIGAGSPTSGAHEAAHESQRSSTPGAQSPEAKAQPQSRRPDRVAAGMHALAGGLEFTLLGAGFNRRATDWLKVNTKDGCDFQ